MYVILSKCDNVIQTFKYTCHEFFKNKNKNKLLLLFLGLKFCGNVKRKYLVTFFFEKEVIRFAKN